MAADPRVMAMVRRKLNVTWDDPDMGLLLSACLYEFSDALDEFWENYRRDLDQARLLHSCDTGDDGGA